MANEGTKKNYEWLIAEHCGLDPEESRYLSRGGTVTREFYVDVAGFFGVLVPSTANKAWAARMAILSVGGNPENAVSSKGGTETRLTLKEIYDNL